MNFVDKIINKIKYSSKLFSFLDKNKRDDYTLVNSTGTYTVVNDDELETILDSLEFELTLDDLDTVTAGMSPGFSESPPITISGGVSSEDVVELDDTLELFPGSNQDFEKNVENDDAFWEDLDNLMKAFEEEKETIDEFSLSDSEKKDKSSSTFIDGASFFKKAGDLPSFEPKLSPNLSNVAQASFITPEPVKAGPSIIDRKLVDLLGMDLDEVRSTLLAEVKDLENASSEYRKVQLQKIFSKLLSYQPVSSSVRNYKEDEQRFYAELIATPGLITEPYVVSFLRDDFYSMHSQTDVKKNLLLKISDYYVTHSQDAIDKFNYVFKSSDYVSTFFLDNPDIPLDSFFSERITSMFDKEDLSLMYRFYLNGSNSATLGSLFAPEKDKALFMMSFLNKKVKQLTGHSAEFLECSIALMNADKRSIVPILSSFYDSLVGDRTGEKGFIDIAQKADDVEGIKDLINFIVESKYNRGKHPLFGINSYEIFVQGSELLRAKRHEIIFGDTGVEKAMMGLFKPEDFPKASSFSHDDKDEFVSAFLSNIYGISLTSAQYFAKHYGKYLKDLEKGILPRQQGMSDEEYLASLDESKMTIMKKDLPAFHMLKAICSLVELDVTSPDFEDKLGVLQRAYLAEMQSKGFNYQNPYASFALVEGALNNMYMNTYNKLLMGSKDAEVTLGIDDEVVLLDAGVKFDMLITSLGGVGNIFDGNVDMASKWNTASMSSGQGICSTHISSQNMGVIDLGAPILGFANVPEYSLNMMGTSDIWTTINEMNLRRENKAKTSSNRFFVPGNMMADECRYGYNEILIDRFASSSTDGTLKLQPEYLVYFKFDEDYQQDYFYRMAHKTAKDFCVPIMVVDVPKIKQHECSEISHMRDELFSSDIVNTDLVHDILMRYMNNYTGSLTFIGCGKMYEDFSVDAMRTFINDMFNKALELGETEEAKKWIEALDSACKDERRKYEEAISTGGYKYSVKNFILESFDLEGKISRYLKGEDYDPDKTAELTTVVSQSKFEYKTLDDGTVEVVIPDEEYQPELKCVVDFVAAMGIGSKFCCSSEFDGETGKITNTIQVDETEDLSMVVVENLVVSYLLEDLEHPIVDEVIYNKGDVDIEFTSDSDFDFNAAIFESPYKDVLLEGEGEYEFKFDKVEQYITKIESMSSQEFLQIFTPVIIKKAKETGVLVEDISSRMLDKKETIREKFELLQKQVSVAKSGGDPLEVIEDSKKV